MSSEHVIEADALSKEYLLYNQPQDRLKELLWGGRRPFHRRFKALQGVSFRIPRGSAVGVVGRNGSGKSTLLQLIAGTLSPTSGSVQVRGKVSALLELGSGFNPDFTGRENVYLYGSLMQLTRAEVQGRLDEVLAFADIGDFVDQPIKTYSSGMHVRLAFAAAIHIDPDVLLIDEALAVGDAAFQLKCFDKIREFRRKGKTIVFVSHDINGVNEFCDRVLVLSGGELVFDGLPKDAVHIYKAILFGGAKSPTPVNATVEPPPRPDPGQPPPARPPLEDTPPLALNRHEYRFGSRDAEIFDIRLLGEDDAGQNVFVTKEETTVVFKVKAHRTIKEPVYGLRFRNKHGVQVYGKNSIHQRFTCPPLLKGATQEVRFRQRLHLMAGDYFLSVGVSEVRDGDVIALDRRQDVFSFTVIGSEGGGIVNLDSTLEIREVQQSFPK
jgi:ABC-type polysaccharide/polyol phosphate transport system ATPase subunit